MAHSEIVKRIHAITEKGKAYARTHANEIKVAQASCEEIDNIIASAACSRKKSWSIYESFKNKIANAANSAEEYDSAVCKLANVLDL